MEWVTTSGCAMHDAHNSLTWAMRFYIQNTELMSDIYIVVASIRDSFVLLLDHLGGWIQSRVVLAEDEKQPDPQL
eukprot:13041588-Alexandrium_andersonii.AAC.1